MVRAVVSDGITIGHPCCNVVHCMEPLVNKRDRFCPGHEHMEKICSVEGCNRPVLEGYLTCDDSDHLAIFKTYQKRNGANFQLKSRLERTTVSKPPDEDIADHHATGVAPDEGIEEACPQKPDGGNRRLRARFGRRQTHNEQLIVRPCGMIIAHTTFYGSETVPQTVVSSIIFLHCASPFILTVMTIGNAKTGVLGSRFHARLLHI